MSKKKLAKMAAFALAAAMAAGSFAGCSNNAPTSSGSSGGTSSTAGGDSGSSDSGERFKMTFLAQTFATEVQTPDSRVWQMIEDYTNTDLDITWKPSAGFDENINVQIASNNLPMVITVRDNKAPVVSQAVDGGVFWEIKPEYLEKFPNLSKINMNVAKNVMYGGKMFSLYKWAELSRSGWHYRKDWADKLGLDAPTTIDEIYEMAHAFTYDDPDGNGQDDTFGLAMAADIAVKLQFHSMVVAYGGGNEWVADGNGGVIPTFMTEPYIQAMDFFKKLYAEKAMNQDYPSASKNNIYEYWTSGQCGMFYMSLNDSFGQGVQNIFKNFPDAENDIFSLIESPDGSYRCYPTSGWKGMFMMSTKAVKDEDTLMKVLNFFDKMEDREMQELYEYGIEGEHYNVTEDGKIELINREDFQTVCGDFGQLAVHFVDNKREAIYTPIQAKAKQMIAENEPYAIPNVVDPFVSETQSQLGTTLDQIIYDARDKYIIGAITLDEFKAEVEKWRSQGGDKIIEEYSAQYKAAGGQ